MKNLTILLIIPALWFSCTSSPEGAMQEESAAGPPPEVIKMAALDQERGLAYKSEDASDGYVLFSSLSGSDLFMINKDGEVVKIWNFPFALDAHYITEDGNIIVNARDPEAPKFSGGGMAGRILEFDWDGNQLWEYKLADENFLQHHDVALMPNGNILALVWHEKSPEEALAAGRKPHTIPKAGLWPDKIVEIKPTYPSGGEIVWEWDFWDHLVQEEFPELANYGIVKDHPGKIQLNDRDSLPEVDPEELEKDKARGNAAANATVDNRGSDMYHSNAINYNATLDQIAVSVPSFSEVWIIDHSLTTEEAATDKGDIMYRWGNPEMYDRGDSTDRVLGFQHDVRWIPEGYADEGKLMIFNNNARTSDGREYTQVVVIDPPMNADGEYVIEDNKAFGPEKPYWTFDADDSTDVHAMFISSAHRMKNGNTLVNFGPQGKFVEVSPTGEEVWEYWSPYIGETKIADGSPPQPVGPFKFAVFRATHISSDHPAIKDRTLEPLAEQPAVAEQPPKM